MKDEHFFVVQGWMVNRLHLSGTELMVYAIINGFCQHGDGDGFVGGNATLMSWTGASARTIGMTLQSLEKKGLIEREYIKTAKGRIGKIRTHGAESAPPIAQNLPDGCGKNCATHEAKIAPITYTNNTYISPNGEREGSAERFTPPTLDEVKAYVHERGDRISAEAFVAYYESIGWKSGKTNVTDWKAKVRLWEAREKKQPEQRQQPKGTFFDFPQREIDEEDEAALELRLRRKALGKD